MFKKILVPVDGSRTSCLGLEEAIELAKDQHGALYLLHVLEEQLVIQNVALASGASVEQFQNSMRESGKKILSGAEAMAKKAHIKTTSVMVETRSDPTADLIVKQAKKLKADLIVLGTHGRHGLKRLVMGSDAEQVVRNAPVPVLLVRSSVAPEHSRARRPARKRTVTHSARH